jgi:chromosome segregation ATPase
LIGRLRSPTVRREDNASAAMAVVVDERTRADARVRELELERHEAGRAVSRAGLALAELERSGGAAADRRALEDALAKTKAKASEPWPERIADAQAAARDARAAVQRLAAEKFDELREELEQEGVEAAERLTAAAAEVVAAYAEREAVAGRLTALAATAGAPLRPGDVAWSKAERLALEARRVADEREVPPAFRRNPRVPPGGTTAAKP